MKNIIYVFAFLLAGTVLAQDKPTEIKEETELRTVKYKHGNDTKEKKLKVVTRETANVNLDPDDANKLNQSRIDATQKVSKMVMIDDDADDAYDVLTKATYYVDGDKNYKFIPNEKGFDIAFDNDNNKFVKRDKAWATNAKGNYIIQGKIYSGIGYFDKNKNFVVEYFNEKSGNIEVKVYKKSKINF